ncbi:c-type cytochrome [Kaarinaea lacus]
MSNKSVCCGFASIALLVLSTAVYAAGDAAAGEEKATQCTSCHGVDGQGSETDPKTKIAGMSVGKFKEAMQAYKSGERNNAMMQMFAKKLSDQDVDDLAAYYAAK